VGQLKDAAVTFHGEGLVQAIMRHTPIKKPKAADLAFLKSELITSAYRDLNKQLHADNPMYEASGVKHVETVQKLAESIGTKSVLDYGCGKGLLGKGLPFPIWEYDPAIEGKDELPRPADLVVCTDVLEHIEPELLRPVLTDLARCVKKVGYFVIHTGPAQKTLADGRNAHLIQKGREWWEKVLLKFFDVAKVVEEPPDLKIIVSPKTKPKIGDTTTVSHLGTSVTFKTPNEATHWRAQSLFTKEPVTIEWIESFQKGEVLWDVGANVGGYTIWAGARKGVEVYAFEPEANNYAILCENIRLNQVNALAYCMAISDQMKSSTLYCSKPDVGGSCHTFGQDVGFDLQPREGVKQGAMGMPLDALAGMVPFPNHIKIDVDGLEHLVIAGGKQFFADHRLKSVLIEVNTNLQPHQEMVKTLESHGFRFDAAQVARATRTKGAFEGCAEYVFTRESSVEACVLEKIKTTPLTMKPFPHLVIEDIFPAETYSKIMQDLPSDAEYEPLAKRGTTGYPTRSTHPSPSYLSWMTNGALRKALDEKFGVVSGSDETLFLRDKPGYSIPPHTDTPSKAVTMLVYLGDSRHGTTVYAPKEKGFEDPRGLHHPWNKFRTVKTFPGIPNSTFIFARTNTSFHGTKEWTGPGVRDILLYDSKVKS
jgi:FkbM family methyltransferase